MRREKTLWEKNLEHDACGMGFVANIHGEESHTLIEYALTMLTRMNHRGGTGAEPDTGDGAGVLLSMPHKFFEEVAKKLETTLPERGDYAVGMFFLPKKQDEKEKVFNRLHSFLEKQDQTIIFIRDVPIHFENCGPGAQRCMPSIVQIAIKRSQKYQAGRVFEDALFELRRKIEKEFQREEVYVCSLSSKTICYKGMLHAFQVGLFFDDLQNETFESKICLTHSRFSTNTFPSWNRAQPFRFLAHNGEINTLRGAENWMIEQGIEIYDEDASDSAKLENCMEFFYRNGRSIPEALMLMIPESFEEKAGLDDQTASFYEYATSFIAPWDGPAGLVFTDGEKVGAALDRNGLRPSRYSLTDKGFLVISSESGVVDFDPSEVVEKGVLGPGNILVVDTQTGIITKNDAFKESIVTKHDYSKWLEEGLLTLDFLDEEEVEPLETKQWNSLLKANGYTDEVIRTSILPMAEKGDEPVIAMGYDAPLSVLSDKPQSLFTFFKQQFAQVTNPPIDALREDLVIGLEMYLGRDAEVSKISKDNCQKIKLENPVLSPQDFAKLSKGNLSPHKVATLSTVYLMNENKLGLENAIESLLNHAEEAIKEGHDLLILSDRGLENGKLYIPVLLACAALKYGMVKRGLGNQFSIIIDSMEVIEVHHFATLLGYGASAIYPYGAYEIIRQTYNDDEEIKIKTFQKACVKGIVKVMSRIGISTISGYASAQLFEAVGLHEDVIEKYFKGTISRVSGLNLKEIEEDAIQKVDEAFSEKANDPIESGGFFQVKSDGEYHLYNPNTIYNFQQALRNGDYEQYKTYSKTLEEETAKTPTAFRHCWKFESGRASVPLTEVEPVSEIVKRFKVGAMSFGSLSKEAHECIAQAMNELGGKSNSGEGGEHRNRFGTVKNSRIKQIASGRFGVNAEYLMSADELQIKMAQGAKPGEGGQLPGEKVFPWVAEIRGSTPGVRLISPPPHHDIYSIEDLAQLIYDLKMINPYAKINVKLVSSTGVGTIASGCVKAGADVVVISGFDGGTGASPKVSVRDAGLPLELGLSEAHQILSMNDLRNRVTLECDGKLMTAKDVLATALLGAEEFSFASLTLVAIGCVMMRVCSLNTCPVGVATQNPELRKHFVGKVEHVKNAFLFLAEELREHMAELGFHSIDELIGHTEVICVKDDLSEKAKTIDFSRMIGTTLPIERKLVDPFENKRQWPELDMITEELLNSSTVPTIRHTINNTNRTQGARLSGWIAERYGNDGLKEGQLKFEYTGIAGQSFAAFLTKGLELKLNGEANDYIAKGLSGGRVIVTPPKNAGYDKQDSFIIGNVSCFGANSGEAYFQGRAGERFCVRNSGANVVVEGVGDHGCEYMTGGVAVVLGTVGRNFAAGMSGGVAYVYDEDKTFTEKCNMEMVDLYSLNETTGDEILKELLHNHYVYTQSEKAAKILGNWKEESKKFIKVYPKDYHKVMDIKESLIKEGVSEKELDEKAFDVLMKGGL